MKRVNPKILLRASLIALLILALILVRKFQEDLFYDPFLKYFGSSNRPNFPDYNFFKLYSNVVLRYLLNSSISVLIIYLIFKNKNMVVDAIKIYTIVGFVGITLYAILLENKFPFGELPAFYLRRILIQPILLLVLIAAFYYENNLKKKES